MRRGAKPGKAKAKARLPVARKSPKLEASGYRELEKRLAEALKREAEALKRESEALEQQTATSEILGVISSSPTHIQTVYASIVERAVRLCSGLFGTVILADGDMIQLGASFGFEGAARETIEQALPAPLASDLPSAWAIRERRILHLADAENSPYARWAQRMGFRSYVSLPMVKGDSAIGAIAVGRTKPDAFSDRQIAILKTFADQAVIAVENVRLFKELEVRNRDLTEALEQQTATAEILRVISGSPTDLQPVLHAVAESAARLCEAQDATIWLRDGDRLLPRAHLGPIPHSASVPIVRGSVGGRAVIEGRTFHINDLMSVENEDEFPVGRAFALQDKFRTTLATPLLRQGVALGVILIRRGEVRPFSEAHISLLQTFADQAVIAIENVRLFNELEGRNRDLTATSEILRVISRSPTDVQPVFDTIVRSAVSLCDGLFGAVLQFDGELLHFVAQHNHTPEALEEVRRVYPARPTRGLGATRAILERAVVHIPDVEVDPEYQHHAISRAIGFRSGLFVPMLREGAPIGVIMVSRAKPGPFSDSEIELLKTFADQAVIAVENVRLFTELRASNRELTTALDTQTATSDILRVISQSQRNVQPVFDAIVASAVRLLGAYSGMLTRVAGDQIELAALTSTDEAGNAALRAVFPRSLHSEGPHPKAIRDRVPFNIADAHNDPTLSEAARATFRIRGSRSQVVVPLLRHDEAVGALGVARREPGGFTDDEIALLKTFADQAVIAIENVRLFNELEGRNRDLTATSEILRVISQSPTDIQPVFDAVAESAARLCEAQDAGIFRRDGDRLLFVAHHGPIPFGPVGEFSIPLVRGTANGRSVLDAQTIHVADLQTEVHEYPEGSEGARRFGHRTFLIVPLMREGVAIGSISVRRTEAQLFTDRQVALLQTFADQAVIAIENVRLFKELEARNRELRVSLDQQTATSELLKVIGRSTLDLQPIFETLAENAITLCAAERALIYRFDGQVLRVVATHNASAELITFLERNPMALTRSSAAGRASLERRTIHLQDVLADPEYTYGATQVDAVRTVLGIPMLRADELLGVIIIYRHEVLPFTDSQVALMETFADQAAIAIENARLLSELQARTAELTRSVQELQALGEVSQALSSTLDLETVLSTIVSRASELAGAAGCSIYEYDEATEHFELRATHNDDAQFVEALRAAPLRKGEGLMGRAAEMREPVQIPDITQPGAYQSSVRDTLIRFGYRALLAVPLLREDQIIGSLSFNRKEPGEFPPEVVDVLKTFATQSALAIQNARLFREIADKSQQLEAASRHKSEFLANMSHELRTPLNAIIGFSEILAEKMFGDVNEKQTEYLQDILESGRHLLSLINDILDLSKVEAGRMELELSEFDLPNAIDNALILVRERATRRGITLGRTIDEQLGTLRGDERKVKQVLLNLLSNALKFTPEGGRIDVSAGVNNGVAEIAVADTGVGIAPEDQEAVFEEFRQVGTADKKVEGTGLGLALSRKFIELHGGRIWVQSQVGHGSTFTFTLPVRREA